MNRAAILTLIIAGGAFVAVFAVQADSARRTRQELAEVRARLERLEARPKETAAAPAAAVEELRAEIARVEARASAPGARAGAAPAAAVTEEDVLKVVDERVEAKLQEKAAKPGGGGGGDRKMPLHDLAKELAIDPRTQAKVAEIADACKRDIFAVARTPRADGTNIADDLIGAMLSGEGARIQQVFVKLMTDKIPGTETTYLAAISGLQDQARQGLKGVLGEALYTRYQHMNVTPDHIETGYDPFGEYVKEKGIDPSKFGK